MQEQTNIVWYKKDLRITDHRPLLDASRSGSVLCVYFFEPDIMSGDDYHISHLKFTEENLENLSQELSAINGKLLILNCSALVGFQRLLKIYDIKKVFSHEETGNNLSFKRDISIKSWFGSQNIPWIEHPSNGIIRGLKNRTNWFSCWQKYMRNPQVETPIRLETPMCHLKNEPVNLTPNLRHQSDRSHRQKGGRHLALKYLHSFLTARGSKYLQGISSPSKSRKACGRISPYLVYGALSLREVYQQVESLQKSQLHRDLYWKKSLSAFKSRLRWRSHFIQKIESQPSIELHNMNPGFDGMRSEEPNWELLDLWQEGRTGYPIIDASMICLKETGWINFRMRAMLVSFVSFHLWQHWREPANILARLFLDYEPGIHYSQIQMQSGVTGINTIRMYSPLKQATEQDPHGDFIKTYIPSLNGLPPPFVHDPSQLTKIDELQFHFKPGVDYPHPCVDHNFVYNHAKGIVYKWRESKKVKKHTEAILNRLVCR